MEKAASKFLRKRLLKCYVDPNFFVVSLLNYETKIFNDGHADFCGVHDLRYDFVFDRTRDRHVLKRRSPRAARVGSGSWVDVSEEPDPAWFCEVLVGFFRGDVLCPQPGQHVSIR